MKKIAEKDEILFKDTFGGHLYNWYDWGLDICHKIKSNYEILVMSLKENNIETLRGAYSKSKIKNGEIKKFHFTEGEKTLQIGHTNKKGNIIKSQTTDFFPEKYRDYLWLSEDQDLFILSDYYGLFGEKKPIEKIVEEWQEIRKKRGK